ncbi:hypothetical protein EJD97_004014 [Solanum chilense]|uniref:Amino acid transporter transmembrane domain-containing protein n=1 Tax=Solanum chilense TaxID=4083 RepID=A0A6N2C1W8_SOLCI|nr:hypothetical protein EJD97_004014 [Solanum chilense]
MGDSTNFAAKHPVSINVTESKRFDDDGRIKRSGSVWTASAHIITAVIGSGVLSLAWAVAQLGWIAGPIVMLLFSFVTYYTSSLLSDCYRSGDPLFGKRNYTYMDVVQANLSMFYSTSLVIGGKRICFTTREIILFFLFSGGLQVKICGWIQYVNLFGVAIGYTIASSISLMAVKRSDCFHKHGHKAPCLQPNTPYMIIFGVIEIIFSQIPDFDQIWWLSIVAAVMSFTYSTIGLGLGIAHVAETGKIGGSLTGVSIGIVTEMQKVWRTFQALGAIAFAYSYSLILIEIQDTIKSPPSEAKTMKNATIISVSVTTVFYMLCGCFGYAAFGDHAPDNLLTGFGFYDPYWLLDIANIAIFVHLVGAYQVYCQPLFAFIEKTAAEWYPNSKIITKNISVPIPGFKSYNIYLFRLVWRTIFVIISTIISMLLPFFSDIVGILGAFGFWPLTVYYPVEIYIVQKKIPKWSRKWFGLQILSVTCLIVSIAAAVGSFAGVVSDLKVYKPFKFT